MGLTHMIALAAGAVASMAEGTDAKPERPKPVRHYSLPASRYTQDSKGTIHRNHPRNSHGLRGRRRRKHSNGVTEKQYNAAVADRKGNLNIFVALCEKERKKVKRGRMAPNDFADRWLGTDAVKVIMSRESLRTGQRFV